MQYRAVGRSGLKVSELCLGTLDPELAARLEAVSRPAQRYPRAFEARAVARRAEAAPPS